MEVAAADPVVSTEFSRRLIDYAEERVNNLSAQSREDSMRGALEGFERAEVERRAAQEALVRLQIEGATLDPEGVITSLRTQISELESLQIEKEIELANLLNNARPNQSRVDATRGEIQILEDQLNRLNSKMTDVSRGENSLAELAARIQIGKNAGNFFSGRFDGNLFAQMGCPIEPVLSGRLKSALLPPAVQLRSERCGKRLEHAFRRHGVTQAPEIGSLVHRKRRMGETIDPETDNDRLTAIREKLRLKQNAGQLRSIDQQIVRPFQLHQMECSGRFVNCVGQSHRCNKRQFTDPVARLRVDQQQAGEEVADGRRPVPPPASPAFRLFSCTNPEIARMSCPRPLKTKRIGGTDAFQLFKEKARRTRRRTFREIPCHDSRQNSDCAAALAAFTTCPGASQNRTTNTLDRPSTTRSSIGMASKPSTGSSKNMTLTILR